jgi:hypothetical protein
VPGRIVDGPASRELKGRRPPLVPPGVGDDAGGGGVDEPVHDSVTRAKRIATHGIESTV